MECSIGMKRKTIVALRDELTKALDSTPEGLSVSVTMYGDTDPRFGHVLSISSDDMERDEVPADAIYVEVEE